MTQPRKPILLTGASGNLGRVLARELGAQGWTLRLTDILPFPDALPPRARFVKADLNDGVALLHTIGRPDGPGATNGWIEKYIFPGGYIPSLSEMAASVEKAGLFITDVEILRMHYAETLKAWRERFMARREEAKTLYDERFCRMWEFYLSISELTFRIEGECVFQVQIAKRHDLVPITRGYMAAREDELRKVDSGDLNEEWRAAAQ